MSADVVSLVLVGIALTFWCVTRDVDRPLARWWVRVTRSGPAAGIAVLVQLAALGAVGLVLLAGHALGDAWGHPRWGLLLLLPAFMAYGPFALASIPGRYTEAYTDWREELEGAGATESQARQIAWWGGPPAYLGLVLCMVSLFVVFLG